MIATSAILADTSVWVDHFRRRGSKLIGLLNDDRVWMHPFVIGELACGNLSDRTGTLKGLAQLPEAPVATHAEALTFIEGRSSWGRGIGYIDIHLLASVALAGSMKLWTHDRPLRAVAQAMGTAYEGDEGD